MILVFSRSKEANGINEIKRFLSSLNENFIVVDNNVSFTHTLLKANISSIFCLASTEVILSIAITKKLHLEIPIIMGVYHPNQWKVMLYEDYSKTRCNIFKMILSKIPIENIIFNTKTAQIECTKDHLIHGEPNIVLAPAFCPKADIKYKVRKERKSFSVVTVGRFVDFKIKSVINMIDTVERLNNDGYDVEYHIYGNGPSQSRVLEKTTQLKYKHKIFIHGFLNPNEFGNTVLKYDVYFGMGFTVVHAAMLGLPSLIAIQDEEKSLTYGFFHEHNHTETPMFGDPTKGKIKYSIYEKISEFSNMSEDEVYDISYKSKVATIPYQPMNIVTQIATICRNAKFIKYEKISFFDVVKIRLETHYSRFKKIKQLHT
jgi:glycosyltransferase involved in cell wall biosynthesis